MAKFSLCKDEDIYAISRKDDKLLIILRHEKHSFSKHFLVETYILK
jgi:hypothetical protein